LLYEEKEKKGKEKNFIINFFIPNIGFKVKEITYLRGGWHSLLMRVNPFERWVGTKRKKNKNKKGKKKFHLKRV